jgi:hypothetical protein
MILAVSGWAKLSQASRWGFPGIEDRNVRRFEIVDVPCGDNQAMLGRSCGKQGIDGRDQMAPGLHARNQSPPDHHHGDVKRQDTIGEADEEIANQPI